jgi:hypothetical protein
MTTAMTTTTPTAIAITIPVGTKVTVGMDLLLVGWVRWDAGKPVEHRMTRVIDGQSPQRRTELGDDDRSLWEIDHRARPAILGR